MTHSDHHVGPGSAFDVALERALEAAGLRAGGATTSASLADRELSAAETGTASGVSDADAD